MCRNYQPDEMIAGQYRVERVLGGGMGLVYVAVDAVSGKRFALKTIRDDTAGDDSVARFEREARAWINLGHHPHVVQAHAFIRSDDQPFLLLELVDGPSLSQVLKQVRPLAPAQAIPWALQLCAGMQFVHSGSSGSGMIHRDLKPGNLLLTKSGALKITDFGLAKVQDDRHLTATNQVLGTLSYCSPEQLRSARDVDVRSDIFSFGVLLYEMLTGRRPFIGDTPTEVIEAVQHRDPPIDAVPRSLRRVVMTCLQKSPGRRFASFHEVAVDLGSVDVRPEADLSRCGTCGFEHTLPVTCPVCGHAMAGNMAETVIYGAGAADLEHTDNRSQPSAGWCKCGAKIAPEARYCRSCGTVVPTIKCGCGLWNSAANDFCNGCGERLIKEPPTQGD